MSELKRDAVLSREGGVLTQRPAKVRSLLAVLKSLEPLDESLPEGRDSAPERLTKRSKCAETG